MSQRSRTLVSLGRLVSRYLWKQVQWEMRRPLTTSLQMERTMSLPQSGLTVFGFVLLLYAIHSFWGRGRRRRRERGQHLTPPQRVKAYHKLYSKPHSSSLDMTKSSAEISRLKNDCTNWLFNDVLKAHLSGWLSFLLLLLAGDVELNPGPYGNDDEIKKLLLTISDKELAESDYSKVILALKTVEAQWKQIGIQLGITFATLDSIAANYPLCCDRLSEIIKEWSRLNYDTQEFGLPSWRKLAEAVATLDKRLSRSIADEHPEETGGASGGIESKKSNAQDLASPDISKTPSASSTVEKETQTIMLLPSKLQVHVPVHCARIKAISSETKPNGNDEKLTLAVSLLDASTGTPLKCIVALCGDRTPSHGQVVCFLSLSVVSVVGDNRSSTNHTSKESTYKIWRSKRSGYTANGQAMFYMCFYEADANYIVTLNVDTVIDEEGIQCLGYAVEHYTGFISTLKTVESNAFKAPPLLKYEGALASPRFNSVMTVYNKMFYEGKTSESNMIASMITSGSDVALDMKLYMSVTKATERSLSPQAITELEEILQRSQSMESHNGFLLEALIKMALSQVYSLQGNKGKALECIHRSRSICLEAAPSHLTSCVFFNDARNMIGVNSGNITAEVKRRILELFDRAIADSYYGVGWERLMIFNGHVYKALFILNGTMNVNSPSTINYVPTKEDISIAEQHLKAAPLDTVHEIHRHMVIHHIATSDLYRWKGNSPKAREYAEKAKYLCVEKGYFQSMIKAIDDRLKLLKPDTIDKILEMYKGHV